jgi:chromosome segregation ATPase
MFKCDICSKTYNDNKKFMLHIDKCKNEYDERIFKYKNDIKSILSENKKINDEKRILQKKLDKTLDDCKTQCDQYLDKIKKLNNSIDILTNDLSTSKKKYTKELSLIKTIHSDEITSLKTTYTNQYTSQITLLTDKYNKTIADMKSEIEVYKKSLDTNLTTEIEKLRYELEEDNRRRIENIHSEHKSVVDNFINNINELRNKTEMINKQHSIQIEHMTTTFNQQLCDKDKIIKNIETSKTSIIKHIKEQEECKRLSIIKQYEDDITKLISTKNIEMERLKKQYSENDTNLTIELQHLTENASIMTEQYNTKIYQLEQQLSNVVAKNRQDINDIITDIKLKFVNEKSYEIASINEYNTNKMTEKDNIISELSRKQYEIAYQLETNKKYIMDINTELEKYKSMYFTIVNKKMSDESNTFNEKDAIIKRLEKDIKTITNDFDQKLYELKEKYDNSESELIKLKNENKHSNDKITELITSKLFLQNELHNIVNILAETKKSIEVYKKENETLISQSRHTNEELSYIRSNHENLDMNFKNLKNIYDQEHNKYILQNDHITKLTNEITLLDQKYQQSESNRVSMSNNYEKRMMEIIDTSKATNDRMISDIRGEYDKRIESLMNINKSLENNINNLTNKISLLHIESSKIYEKDMSTLRNDYESRIERMKSSIENNEYTISELRTKIVNEQLEFKHILESKNISTQNEYEQKSILKYENAINEKSIIIDQLKTEIKKLSYELSIIRSKMTSENSIEIDNIKKQFEIEKNRLINVYTNTISQLQSEMCSITENHKKNMNELVTSIKDQKSNFESRLREKDESLDNYSDSISKLKREYNERINNTEYINKNLSNDCMKMSEKIQAITDELVERNNIISKLNVMIDEQNIQIAELTEKISMQHDEIDTLTKLINEYKSKPDDKIAVIASMRKTRDECIESLKKKQEEITKLSNENTKLKNELERSIDINLYNDLLTKNNKLMIDIENNEKLLSEKRLNINIVEKLISDTIKKINQ